MNRNPLTSLGFSLRYHSPKGSDKTAPETGCGDKINFFRQPHQVNVGVFNCNELSERPPMSEPRLKLVVADLVIPGCTLATKPAAADKGERDPVTLAPIHHQFSNLPNHACQFMAGYMR